MAQKFGPLRGKMRYNDDQVILSLILSFQSLIVINHAGCLAIL